jgi:hypothetical protein
MHDILFRAPLVVGKGHLRSHDMQHDTILGKPLALEPLVSQLRQGIHEEVWVRNSRHPTVMS